ncbi:hypothetical protein AVEN_183816-1 [Araneus ventricosus]|uniref:Uncharacterized protein n=1 Tax=Araneus ventricosus TaxID=182803 RepID=A0A4Y2NAY5_ARAVE|nr:hypothetical protein AVEN_183816-1 [Araneus ventricosus]
MSSLVHLRNLVAFQLLDPAADGSEYYQLKKNMYMSDLLQTPSHHQHEMERTNKCLKTSHSSTSSGCATWAIGVGFYSQVFVSPLQER